MPPLGVSHDGGVAELKASSCGCDESARSHSEYDPYAPAESLRLRIGEDIDWSDVVGAVAVLERDDSTKGAAANPKSCAARRSAAGRSSLSASAPAPRAAVAVVIGGLPAAAGKAVALDHGRGRRSPCQLQLQLGCRARVFASGEASGCHQAEPGSPKVSCLGGVRSQPRTAGAEGSTTGRRWWAWPLVADVMSFCCCCWKGRRDRRPRASEAE